MSTNCTLTRIRIAPALDASFERSVCTPSEIVDDPRLTRSWYLSLRAKETSNARQSVRVNVQFVDTESGNHLWAERFEKPVTDLFDMQDEIVARLANSLNAQLIIAEARRAERAPRSNSMDLYFRGMSAYNKALTPDNLSEARKLFERALTLDPGNVDAIVGAALASIVLVGMHLSDDRAVRLAAAEALAVKALSIAPEKASGHLCLGVVYIYTNRAAQGISEFELSISFRDIMRSSRTEKVATFVNSGNCILLHRPLGSD